MSTDDRHAVDWRPAVGGVLGHPLVGRRSRPAMVAVAYLVVLTALFAVSYAGSVVTVGGAPLETLTPRFDAVSTVLIAVAAATMTVVPFLYAAWNGGPALSFVLPLAPIALGDLAAGRYVLGVDAAIALTVGAAACTLALFAGGVRRTGTLRPWRRVRADEHHLLFVTMATVVAAVGVGQFAAGAPPRVLEWYAPFGALWLVPAALLGAYWQAAVRTTVAARADADDRSKRSEP